MKENRGLLKRGIQAIVWFRHLITKSFIFSKIIKIPIKNTFFKALSPVTGDP
ncbi:hypothetical protein BRO54_2509 [Geobacillus proteiniphilus]|uniref:Uncharacterized protein n=1 Tax=Geobacillus proteiniphilus TaxID=860353 RepID=A0A1Q5SVU7_9BACL|nr:hypothetical protein BRO54_2509 [Geobacillus proteiniphilus]